MCRTAGTVGGVMYNSLVLLGPTACGKTAVAVQLASLLDGEIISADSRQVYRGLDIGSGKDLNEFTLAEADGSVKTVPYHLIDVVSLPEQYNVYSFQRDAYEAFSLLQSHNKLPVIIKFCPKRDSVSIVRGKAVSCKAGAALSESSSQY